MLRRILTSALLFASPALAFSPPPENFERVREAVENAGHHMSKFGLPFCREDGEWCEGDADEWIRIQAYGRGIIEVMTTSQLPHSQYRDVCAAAFAGLSGAAMSFADEVIAEAFQIASAQGSFNQDIQGVEIEVRPSSDDVLGCQFFKY